MDPAESQRRVVPTTADARVLGPLASVLRILKPAWAAGLFLTALSCSRASDVAATQNPSVPGFVPVLCQADQVREFYCESLLPMSTGLGAPAPYDSCPAGIEAPPGVHQPRERVARFDAAHTEWVRQRAKPGHACCYSWCADLEVRKPSEVPEQAGCDQPGSNRETFCMPELESGTSLPAEPPWDACPVALRPPEVLYFSVPAAAPFDPDVTRARHDRGHSECCYGWCSQMPAGLLERKVSQPPR